MHVEVAKEDLLSAIIKIDEGVVGTDRRKEIVEESIKKRNCLVAIEEGEVKGFLLFDTTFFDHAFISLVMVPPKERRKRIASMLLKEMVHLSPTEKIFSSTNQSNEQMQQVFYKNGFKRSGIIENLDEGDPELIYYCSR